MDRPAESPVGRTLAGRYLIEELIGSGAMGSVYRARQTEIDKLVAIKILRRDLTADASAVARFKREAKTASRLDHPNSVRMLDYGESDGTCFLVMELLEGRTLFDIAKEEWPLPTERIVDIARQVLAALAVAHDLGIVHRDLKPENIIVRRHTDDEGKIRDVVKVCDFGVAKMNASRAEEAASGSEMLTSHGVIVGTPEYMSPEQSRAEPCDGRSDLYAVGVILYQLLVGRVPFVADAPVSVLLKHVMEEPKRPSSIARDVDPKLEEICLKALSKKPEDRYADAREMRTALRSVLGGSAALSDTASLPRVRLSSGGFATPDAATMNLVVPAIDDAPSTRSLRSQLDSLPPSGAKKGARLLVGLVVAGVALLGVVGLMRGSLTSNPQPAAALATASTTTTPTPGTPHSAATPPTASAQATASSDAPHSSGAAASASAPPATAPSAAPSTMGTPANASAASPSPSPPRSGTSAELLIPASTASAALAAATADPSAVAAAAAAPADAAPPANATGRVLAGSVRSTRASASDVLAVMPIGTFTRCYRNELRTHAGLAGNATLHLHIESDGFIDEASFAGAQELADTGRCIAKAATGHTVRNAQPGTGNAEVDLAFKPE